jgi:DNA-directed RNA polymerase sigma subunit (sigma70/sigma32)
LETDLVMMPLTPRQRAILDARYGRDGQIAPRPVVTLQALAATEGICYQRVWQIEQAARRKLARLDPGAADWTRYRVLARDF